jgi:hypothetical protein
MRNLFDEIAQSLGLRRSDAQVKAVDIQARLSDVHGRMDEFERRLRTMEEIVNRFVETFEGKLQDLARRGLKAKQQTYEELDALRRDLDGYIDILERAVERSSIWRVGRMSVGCSPAPGSNAGTSTT